MIKKVGGIREVARETGLSVATISRVVNGAENVKPQTREKVLLACEKLDYVPNPAARSLSTRRSKTIAAIIPTIEHSVFAKYITAIEQTLSDHDYSLVLAISNSDLRSELKAARQLLGMGAEAFILSGADHFAELLNVLDRRNVPYVFTSVWDEGSPVPTIGYDNYDLAKRAVNYLRSLGHKKIAVTHGSLQESDRTRARREGAVAAIGDGVTIDFYETPLNVEGGKLAVKAMFKSSLQYTALLCFSDVLALGAYFSLMEAGLKVPDDISVMGFDNLDWSGHVVPSLATIDLPAEKMGKEVAIQLVEYLERSKPISPKRLETDIVKRDSVRQVHGG